MDIPYIFYCPAVLLSPNYSITLTILSRPWLNAILGEVIWNAIGCMLHLVLLYACSTHKKWLNV